MLNITSVQQSSGKLFKEKNIRTSHLFLCLNEQSQGPKNAPRHEITCVLHIYADVTARLNRAFDFLI